MITDHPLLGSGIGTFKYNTLRYQAEFFSQGDNRSLYPYGIAFHAHNEYLQLWAELGIIGLGIFLWMVIGYFYYGLKFLRKIKDNYKQGIIIGLMGAVMAVLVDGIFGFPLHLPATVLVFWLFLGLTLTVFQTEEEKRAKESENIKNDSRGKKYLFQFKPFLYIAIIILSIFLCVTLSRVFIARVYWYYGAKEAEKVNLDRTMDIYQKSLKYDPYLGSMYYGIGGILMKYKKDLTLAEEYFKEAEKYTDYPELPQNLASIYLKKGELAKAAVKLEQAISYQKNRKSMLPFYFVLGRTYINLRDYKKAEIAFNKALEIDINSVKAHFSLADAYLKQGKKFMALLEFQKVIKLAPDSIEAKYSQEILNKLK